MSHLLLTAPIPQKLCEWFASCVGIKINGWNLKQLIYRWWEHKMSTKLDQILKAVPAIIMWELWKRRNAKRHRKDISFNYMYHQCQLTIHQLIRVNFPWIKGLSCYWSEMVDTLKSYKPTFCTLGLLNGCCHKRGGLLAILMGQANAIQFKVRMDFAQGTVVEILYMQKLRVWGLLQTWTQRQKQFWKPLSIALGKN